MHLQLQTAADRRIALFGISDFTTNPSEGTTEIAFHRDVGVNADRQYQTQPARVVSSVSESGYDEEGAYETIGDLASDDDLSVIVAETDRYPWIAKAARRLKQEGDVADGFEFIEQENQ